MHTYFNMSDSASVRGPWNQGQGPWGTGEEWIYIDEPIRHVRETGVCNNKRLSEPRSSEVKRNIPKGDNQWSSYNEELESPSEVTK
jgi:Mn-containing catalase